MENTHTNHQQYTAEFVEDFAKLLDSVTAPSVKNNDLLGTVCEHFSSLARGGQKNTAKGKTC